MSMRDYAVDDYGLLMTDKSLKLIAAKTIDWYTEEDYDENYTDYWIAIYENGIVEYISEFTGEAMEIDDKGINIWNTGEVYNNDSIYYVPVKHYATLFKAPYNNMDELVDEFKEKLSEYLPDNFDYRKYIRRIVGTYYG